MRPKAVTATTQERKLYAPTAEAHAKAKAPSVFILPETLISTFQSTSPVNKQSFHSVSFPFKSFFFFFYKEENLFIMAELTQAEVVYSPRSLQVWRALLNWIAFFFQIFAKILRALGHHPLLSSSSSSPSPSPSSHAFKPLPAVELPDSDFPATVEIDAVRDSVDGVVSDERIEKLTVVLDLDETLVCAYETSSLPVSLCCQATEAGLKWFELECVSSDKEYEGKPKISYVTVFERPGLHEFLKQVSQFAELILFTAGLEGYARPLVDRIDVENVFSLRLYRPSTISTEYREHVKDLSCLSKDLSRTVIVDNNPFSFLSQPLNGIPCIPFSAGQPHDTQLLNVLLPLLKHLSLQKDVRPVLYEKFHMPEWFQTQGIPSSGLIG